jgi:hypothetical protein
LSFAVAVMEITTVLDINAGRRKWLLYHQLSTPGNSHLWRAGLTQPETLDLISRESAECFILWHLAAVR